MWLVEIIFEVIICSLLKYPGAFILWVLTGFSQPFKELLEIDMFVTAGVALLSGTLIANLFLS